MEEFGVEREELLRNFLELPNGIPDSDTFKRVFEKINPKELSVVYTRDKGHGRIEKREYRLLTDIS